MYLYISNTSTEIVFGRFYIKIKIIVPFVCSFFLVMKKTSKDIENWSNLLFKLKINMASNLSIFKSWFDLVLTGLT